MNGKRYSVTMLLTAAAILAASGPQNAPAEHSGPVVQAVAMVRVITGARLRLDGTNKGSEIPLARETVFVANGIQQPAKLIEFE